MLLQDLRARRSACDRAAQAQSFTAWITGFRTAAAPAGRRPQEALPLPLWAARLPAALRADHALILHLMLSWFLQRRASFAPASEDGALPRRLGTRHAMLLQMRSAQSSDHFAEVIVSNEVVVAAGHAGQMCRSRSQMGLAIFLFCTAARKPGETGQRQARAAPGIRSAASVLRSPEVWGMCGRLGVICLRRYCTKCMQSTCILWPHVRIP